MAIWRFVGVLAVALGTAGCSGELPTMVSGADPARMPESARRQPLAPVVVAPVAATPRDVGAVVPLNERFSTAQELSDLLEAVRAAIAGVPGATSGPPDNVVAAINELSKQTKAVVNGIQRAIELGQVAQGEVAKLQTRLQELAREISALKAEINRLNRGPGPSGPAVNLKPLDDAIHALRLDFERLKTRYDVEVVDLRRRLEAIEGRLNMPPVSPAAPACVQPCAPPNVPPSSGSILQRLEEMEGRLAALIRGLERRSPGISIVPNSPDGSAPQGSAYEFSDWAVFWIAAFLFGVVAVSVWGVFAVLSRALQSVDSVPPDAKAGLVKLLMGGTGAVATAVGVSAGAGIFGTATAPLGQAPSLLDGLYQFGIGHFGPVLSFYVLTLAALWIAVRVWRSANGSPSTIVPSAQLFNGGSEPSGKAPEKSGEGPRDGGESGRQAESRDLNLLTRISKLLSQASGGKRTGGKVESDTSSALPLERLLAWLGVSPARRVDQRSKIVAARDSLFALSEEISQSDKATDDQKHGVASSAKHVADGVENILSRMDDAYANVSKEGTSLLRQIAEIWRIDLEARNVLSSLEEEAARIAIIKEQIAALAKKESAAQDQA